MTGDKTERAVQKLLSETNGHEKTVSDLFALIIAVNEDGEDRHEATLAEIAHLKDTLTTHFLEADERDRILHGLCADFSAHSSDVGAHKHGELHADHMEAHHWHHPRRSTDPETADYSGSRGGEQAFQTKFMWGVGSRFANVGFFLLGSVLMLIINAIVFGRP